MRKSLALIAVLPAALAASAGLAVPGGEIGKLPTGAYLCELPGDAAGPWRVRQPDEDFSIISATNYRAKGTRGSYLLTNDQLVMTSGPHNGKRYHRQSHGYLRLIGEDGEPGKLRCVLTSRNAP